VCNLSLRDMLRTETCPALGMNDNQTGIAIGPSLCRCLTPRGRNKLIGRCQTNSTTISSGIGMNKAVLLYSADTARDLWKLNDNIFYCAAGSALLDNAVAVGGIVVRGCTWRYKAEVDSTKSLPLPAHTPSYE
jgi:hypothetical protein